MTFQPQPLLQCSSPKKPRVNASIPKSKKNKNSYKINKKPLRNIYPTLWLNREAYLLQMFSFCGSLRDLCSLCATAWSVRRLAEDDELWRSVWKSEWPESAGSQVGRNGSICWDKACEKEGIRGMKIESWKGEIYDYIKGSFHRDKVRIHFFLDSLKIFPPNTVRAQFPPKQC